MLDFEDLVKIARKARENAYVPYFGFHVGAALITDDGEIYTGVNIEAAIRTNCCVISRLY